ncbi:unnamed protein product [Durusdinium trenchii]|uniref:Uncharacterized protein n=2 Tax=Durusdinium trenchii TaxID=1381693 RepID=A0ABP0S2V4_9DINO
MTSLDQKLPAGSLVEILSHLPVTSQPPMRSTSQAFKGIMTSPLFRQVRPKEVLVVKPKTAKKMVNVASNLINGFMTPDSLPVVDSIRLEWEKTEVGDKKSMSFKNPFYKFLQLRVGGQQANAEPFEEELYLNGLDPKGAEPALRKAWWASVRSVLDGLPIPESARILLLGDRRLGGRNAYSLVMALVWTGSDYGVLKCNLDPAYLDCNMHCSGGIKENTVTAALGVLLKRAHKINTFKTFAAAFETALNKMIDDHAWGDEWVYPPLDGEPDEDPDVYFDEDTMDGYFKTFDQPDLGSWCFGR